MSSVEATPPPFRLRLWGRLELTAIGGTVLTPRAKRAKALIARVALSSTVPVERGELAEWLWPERTDAQARANLRQLLSENSGLAGSGAGVLRVDRTHIGFERGNCSVDVENLPRLATSEDTAALVEALDDTDPRYLHDLDGITEALDTWLRSERSRVMARLSDAVRQRAQAALEAGDAPSAKVITNAWSRFQPADETMARIGMLADGAVGDGAGVKRRMNTLKAALAAELEVTPSNTTQSAFAQALEAAMRAAPIAEALPPASRPAPAPVAPRPGRRIGLILAAAVAALLAAGIYIARPRSVPATSAGAAEAASLTRAATELIEGRTRAGYARAETLLRRAVTRDPSFAPAWTDLALVVRMPAIWAAGKDPAAPSRLEAESLDYVDRALALDPQSPHAMAVKGMILGARNGSAWLARAVALDPNDKDSWLWYGHALSGEHHYRRALEAYGRAMALAPAAKRSAVAYVELANAMGQSGEADAAVDRLAEVSANRFDVLILRAELARLRGDLGASARFAREARAVAPPNAYQAISTLVLLARAVGDDSFVRAILADRADLAALYLPSIDPGPAIRRAIQSPNGYLNDAFAAQEARDLVIQGRDDLAARAVSETPANGNVETAAPQPRSIALNSTLAVALRHLGRRAEAATLVARLAGDIDRSRAEGLVGSVSDLGEAVVAALRGARSEAVIALNHAIDHGWRGQLEDWPRDPADEPAFASLRTDPDFIRARVRFLRLVERERGKVEPLLAAVRRDFSASK